VAELIVTVLVCPQCSAPVKQGKRSCERCHSEYTFTPVSGLKKTLEEFEKKIKSKISESGENPELLTAMGICQMQRGLYRFANGYFDKAINLLSEDSDTFYYAAIALLNGKRPYLSSLPVIRKVVEYLELALSFSEQGSYYYLQHLVHNDYFEKRQLNCSPSSAELYEKSLLFGLSDVDSTEISKMVGLN